MFCRRRRPTFRDHVIGSLDNVHLDLEIIKNLIRHDIGVDMATNDELQGIKASLTEASTEIPAKLDELLAAVANGETVDPALVADIKSLSTGLADIVPNAPAEEPAPEPEPAPVEETPSE